MTVRELFDLSGEVALVTGGARNLGREAAEALAEAGASVVVTSRRVEAAQAAAAQITSKTGAKAEGLALEATDEGSWKAVIQTTMGRFGRIDILVNNAGGRDVFAVEAVPEMDLSEEFLELRALEAWQQVLSANLTSVFLGCRAVAPIMKSARKGKIINIASVDGMVGRDLEVYRGTGLPPTVPDYLAAKAGVINLTRGLAVVLARYNVYVNAISPAGFERGQPQAFIDRYSAMFPVGRMGRDGIDLKGPILFCASKASDFMVGHNLVIDGGFTAW